MQKQKKLTTISLWNWLIYSTQYLQIFSLLTKAIFKVSSETHRERWSRSLRKCCCTKVKSFTSSVKIKGKGTKVMSLHKSSLLVLSFFLFTGGIAQSQVIDGKKQVPSTYIPPAKKWRVVDGFRSAKFGMNEKQVMQEHEINVSKNVPKMFQKLLIWEFANNFHQK